LQFEWQGKHERQRGNLSDFSSLFIRISHPSAVALSAKFVHPADLRREAKYEVKRFKTINNGMVM